MGVVTLEERVVLVLLVAAGVAAALCLATECEAQASVEYQSDLTTIGRCLVSEAGPVLAPDHAAILAVLDTRARRTPHSTAADIARRYCQVHRRPVGEHGRRVALMDALDLADYAPEVIALVVGYLRGETVSAACDVTPDHWGARTGRDLKRALRAGWRRAMCPGARNAFWRSRR